MKNLNEILDSYKVTELKEFAKNSGVKGYSKLKKAELIDTIISRLANVDICHGRIIAGGRICR